MAISQLHRFLGRTDFIVQVIFNVFIEVYFRQFFFSSKVSQEFEPCLGIDKQGFYNRYSLHNIQHGKDTLRTLRYGRIIYKLTVDTNSLITSTLTLAIVIVTFFDAIDHVINAYLGTYLPKIQISEFKIYPRAK